VSAFLWITGIVLLQAEGGRVKIASQKDLPIKKIAVSITQTTPMF